MEIILDKAHSFFLRNDIQINIQKTEALLAVGKKLNKDFETLKKPLNFGNDTVEISSPNTAHRYLEI